MEESRVEDASVEPDGRREAYASVQVPKRPPVLYPQAARVLRRIVVGLAQKRCETDGASKSEEQAS